MIIIPEHILKSVIDGIVLTIQTDIKTVRDSKETFLYRLFGDLGYGRFKYYEQALKLFSDDSAKSRKIRTKMSFDGELSQFPVMYVTIGSDTHNFGAIGVNEFDRIYGDKDTRIYPEYAVRFTGESSIVIASDSVEETIILYHTIRAMLIACIDTMSLSGLENIQFGGMDIRTDEELVPKNVFMKAISVKYEYEVHTPSTIHSFGENIRELIASNTAQANLRSTGDSPFLIESDKL